MKTENPAWHHTTDATALNAYEKLMEFYENRFKPVFGQANYAWLAVKTGMTKDMVKRYLVGTRKKIDLQEVASLMYYLTNYDGNYKSRTRLSPQFKLDVNYCKDSDECECNCPECCKEKEDEKTLILDGCLLMLKLIGVIAIAVIGAGIILGCLFGLLASL